MKISRSNLRKLISEAILEARYTKRNVGDPGEPVYVSELSGVNSDTQRILTKFDISRGDERYSFSGFDDDGIVGLIDNLSGKMLIFYNGEFAIAISIEDETPVIHPKTEELGNGLGNVMYRWFTSGRRPMRDFAQEIKNAMDVIKSRIEHANPVSYPGLVNNQPLKNLINHIESEGVPAVFRVSGPIDMSKANSAIESLKNTPKY